jgi:Transposase IS116/IS110/IS902 family
MLERIDATTAKIDQVTAQIDWVISPFAHQVAQLDAITGVGVVAAQELIAEIGVEMGRFATAAHLASWANLAPIDHQSASTTKRGATGRGNPWLAATLGEIVAALARTDTFLGERYRRLARRRGKKRAIVAVGNSVLTIVWHLLADPQAHYRYRDLGPDFYASKVNQRRRQRDLVRQRPPTSANSNTSPARRSSSNPAPSNLPPDPSQPSRSPASGRTRLRCAPPGAAACPRTVRFRARVSVEPFRWGRYGRRLGRHPGPGTAAPPAAQRPGIGQMPDRLLDQRSPGLHALAPAAPC